MLNQMDIGWWIVFLFLSLLFAGMELVFVSGGKLQYLENDGASKFRDNALETLYMHFRRFCTTLATGRVLLSVLFVYYTFVILYFHSALTILPSPFVRILVVVVISSLLLILVNEFLPPVLFGKNPDRWSKIFLLPAICCFYLLYPIAGLAAAFSRALSGLLGISLSKEEQDSVFFRVDFDAVVRKNMDEEVAKAEVDSEVKIFRNALDFSSKKVRECMVPRADIVAVSIDTSLDKLKDLFIETGISRILVYKDNLDNIEGYIHIWEIFNNPPDWTNNVASISFVPESMQANQLMSDLMQQRKSLAVVVDEFGGTSGIVTMEDLVEEIFGDIEDEYDVESKFVKRESDKEFVMSGRVEIGHLNEAYQLDIPESDDYSTVAGYLLYHMQRFPKVYETVVIGKYTFKILKVTARKIEVVRLILGSDTAEELLR